MARLPSKPIPAPGFVMISGKRKPNEGTYNVQFRNGWICKQQAYGPGQMNWIHDGGPWDVVAVQKVEG